MKKAECIIIRFKKSMEADPNLQHCMWCLRLSIIQINLLHTLYEPSSFSVVSVIPLSFFLSKNEITTKFIDDVWVVLAAVSARKSRHSSPWPLPPTVYKPNKRYDLSSGTWSCTALSSITDMSETSPQGLGGILVKRCPNQLTGSSKWSSSSILSSSWMSELYDPPLRLSPAEKTHFRQLY